MAAKTPAKAPTKPKARTPKLPTAAKASPAARSQAAPSSSDDKPAATPGIKIFQIFFEPWQRDLLDPAFIPLDNRGVTAELLEFDLFERLSVSEHVKDVPLWGALSWRFSEKTGLTGADLLSQITASPGQDIYFCNPYPVHEALYHNLWLQGETSHPQFLSLVRPFLEAVGLPDQSQMILPSGLFSTANYFVGSPAFWSAYLPWVRSVLKIADAKLPDEIRKTLHSITADDRNLHAGQTYLPFIVERLFPLFLRTAGQELKAKKLTLPVLEEGMNVHLKLLREMRDAAWASKNAWLAACWVNYRNLYLQQANGREWTQQYLRSVTPADIRFG